jgi:hypothetical protein
VLEKLTNVLGNRVNASRTGDMAVYGYLVTE